MSDFKLGTIKTPAGSRAAILVDGTVVDIAAQTGVREHETVLDLLAHWDASVGILQGIAGRLAADGLGTALADVEVLAPLPLPPAIYAAGSNYADHASEMARSAGREPPIDPREKGMRSWHFLKSSRSVVGDGATVAVPDHTEKLDWEAELAVIIGREARHVGREQAMDHVAGYAIANDLSARDCMRRPHYPETSSFRHDWLAHKSFDGACPLGPWITPHDQIRDPHDLAIRLEVNGAVKQDSNTGHMTFDIGDQIADLSARMTLYPGDIILTGTPAGVGRASGQFLKPGDMVTASIEGLGHLRTRFT